MAARAGGPATILSRMNDQDTTLEDRSRRRRRILVSHRARDVADAEAWDLEFWLRQTPEERLAALVAIHRDVALVETGRRDDDGLEL